MRYHWGLAVGHVYTHSQTTSKITNPDKSTSTTHNVGLDSDAMPIASGSAAAPDLDTFQEDGSDVEQLEADDDDLEYVDLTDHDEAEDEEPADDFSDDDMVLAMEDMYGTGSNDW
jgi:hypothetical protein